jgi:hypothetical protein
MITITRREPFSVAHHLSLPLDPDEENMQIAGQCSNPKGYPDPGSDGREPPAARSSTPIASGPDSQKITSSNIIELN